MLCGRCVPASWPQYPALVVVILIGAAGSGKTTVAGALARQTGWRFVDGDDYHSAAAIAKMRAGNPLNDTDRTPWLAGLHAVAAAAVDRREHIIIACSALKQRYRELLRGPLHGVRFVYLKTDEETLRCRLQQRDHFATRPPDDIAGVIRYELGL
jgi:gluconokinase